MNEIGSNNRWYETLSKLMGPVFTEQEFKRFLSRHREKLPFYEEYITGQKILDIGCGFGYTCVPLSRLGYEITAIDINQEVVKAAQENARKYGGSIQVISADAFSIDQLFEQNSFDACISGGFLEHFEPDSIRELVKKQLYVAPTAIADVPIWSNERTLMNQYSDFEKRICKDGVYRNLWNKDFWVSRILQDFNVTHSEVGTSSRNTGSFEKLTLVMKR